jgi:cytochrome c-type biogenesis protein CcmH
VTGQLVFWLAACGLTAVALVLVLRPVLGPVRPETSANGAADTDALARSQVEQYREQHRRGELDAASYEAALAELVRGLDDGPQPPVPRGPAVRSPAGLGWALAVLLPLGAVLTYLDLGRPDAIAPRTEQPGPGIASDPRIPHSVATMVEQLERRLAVQPEDTEGWLMLGRSYATLNRLEDARGALDQALARRPDLAIALVAQAEVLAGLAGNRLDGEPIRLVHRALAVDPNLPRALWLASVWALRSGQPQAAAAFLERIRAQGGLPPDEARQLDQAIARAHQAAGLPAPPDTAGTAGARVEVVLRVDSALAAEVTPTDTVFVFARAAKGPRIPLAVSRHAASELPLTVVLDDTLAMNPAMRLSSTEVVMVGARISRSGSATPAAGDIATQMIRTRPAAGPKVELTLDRKRQ